MMQGVSANKRCHESKHVVFKVVRVSAGVLIQRYSIEQGESRTRLNMPEHCWSYSESAWYLGYQRFPTSEVDFLITAIVHKLMIRGSSSRRKRWSYIVGVIPGINAFYVGAASS